eukprot:9484080-Pyramimonas_sp.AAC.1
MGDPYAVEGFGRAHEYPVEKWSETMRETMEMEDLLRVECPIGGIGEVDLSLTKYADDLTKLHIAGGADIVLMDAGLSEPAAANAHSNIALDEALAEGGWAQNKDKQTTILSLVGQGSVAANQSLRSSNASLFAGGVTPAMRVLGGQIHGMGAITVEVAKRISALQAAFHSLGKFWSTADVAFRLRRSVLMGVQNAGISNLEAYLVTEAQCKRIDTAFIEYCRVAMNGGDSWDGEVHAHILSNEQVFRHWRITPAFLELRVRRLSWLVQFIRFPRRHAQILTALFAELPTDGRAQFDYMG